MFTYRPHTLPQQFFVIGGGGTGGRLIPLLTQFVRSITKDLGPRGWLMDPQIVIIDFDEVEEKNLLRQNFIPSDIGKNKAVVLANRYSRAFGVGITPLQWKIDESFYGGMLGTKLKEEMGPHFLGAKDAVVLMCVDSVKARKQILQAFADMNQQLTKNPYFVIDAGNEDTFGQVKFFHLQALGTSWSATSSQAMMMEAPVMTPKAVSLPFIPIDLNYYDSIVDNQTEASCAELDQTLAINATMAVMMMGVIQNYMFGKSFTFGGRNFDLNGAGSTSWLKLDYIRRSVWFQKNIELLPSDQLRRTFPLGLSAPAKPLISKYISETSEMLLSMGIDPKTGASLKVEMMSIMEEAVVVSTPVAETPVETTEIEAEQSGADETFALPDPADPVPGMATEIPRAV